MNDGGETAICFVGAHGDSLEFLEFAEEVFDQVTPVDAASAARPKNLIWPPVAESVLTSSPDAVPILVGVRPPTRKGASSGE